MTLVLLAVLKLGLKLELGPEYDTNANRAETVAGAQPVDTPISSALLRGISRASLALSPGALQLRVEAGLGGKLFFNSAVADQNVLVGQLTALTRARLAPQLHLGLDGDYYDAWQSTRRPACAPECLRRRDFLSGSILLRILSAPPSALVSLSAGYRGFGYKPDPTFDFHALVLGGRIAVRIDGADGGGDWDVAASYRVERRRFGGFAERNRCPPGTPLEDGCLAPTAETRTDWFHQGWFEIGYVSRLLVGVAYGLELNQSNSFAQALLRHLLVFKAALRLPLEVYFTLKAQLLFTTYFDPVLLEHQPSSQTFLSIEDENRNALVVELERALGGIGLAVTGRYSIFTNELTAQPVSFTRQVFFLGLVYRAGL